MSTVTYYRRGETYFAVLNPRGERREFRLTAGVWEAAESRPVGRWQHGWDFNLDEVPEAGVPIPLARQ